MREVWESGGRGWSGEREEEGGREKETVVCVCVCPSSLQPVVSVSRV